MTPTINKRYEELAAGDFLRLGQGFEPVDFLLVQKVSAVPGTAGVSLHLVALDGQRLFPSAGARDTAEVADISSGAPWSRRDA